MKGSERRQHDPSQGEAKLWESSIISMEEGGEKDTSLIEENERITALGLKDSVVRRWRRYQKSGKNM